ncbi:hypothetical protein [Corynebacterium sp.]|nr:hypothetical protein [Corynebacterium sp.]MDO5076452.1 hypothetical protein [Corynebacterium sp.]
MTVRPLAIALPTLHSIYATGTKILVKAAPLAGRVAVSSVPKR